MERGRAGGGEAASKAARDVASVMKRRERSGRVNDEVHTEKRERERRCARERGRAGFRSALETIKSYRPLL